MYCHEKAHSARPHKENEQMNPSCCFSGFTSIAAADDMQLPVVQRDSTPGKMREGRVDDTSRIDFLFVCYMFLFLLLVLVFSVSYFVVVVVLACFVVVAD